jgi:hypothetical protein
MVPLYAARVRNLRPDDFVVVKWARAAMTGGRPAALPAKLWDPTGLPSLGLQPDERVVDLAPRLRCWECDQKGKAIVSISHKSQVSLEGWPNHNLRPGFGVGLENVSVICAPVDAGMSCTCGSTARISSGIPSRTHDKSGLENDPKLT